MVFEWVFQWFSKVLAAFCTGFRGVSTRFLSFSLPFSDSTQVEELEGNLYGLAAQVQSQVDHKGRVATLRLMDQQQERQQVQVLERLEMALRELDARLERHSEPSKIDMKRGEKGVNRVLRGLEMDVELLGSGLSCL